MEEKTHEKNYVSPRIYIESVQLESGIVCCSTAKFKPGGPNGESTPLIEDWNVKSDTINHGF